MVWPCWDVCKGKCISACLLKKKVEGGGVTFAASPLASLPVCSPLIFRQNTFWDSYFALDVMSFGLLKHLNSLA